jgi:hypothetical protein
MLVETCHVSSKASWAVYRLQSGGLPNVESERDSRSRGNTAFKDVFLISPSPLIPPHQTSFSLVTMPSAFSELLIAQAGPVDGYLHVDPKTLETATSLTGTTFSAVSLYEPWTHTKTATLLAHHPVAVWRHLSAKIASREGSFGRMVTLYCGWAAAGMSRPTTVEDMAVLKGALTRTFGGTGDPGMFTVTIPCPFDGTMTDTLHCPYNAGVRPVFYYAFVEQKLSDKAPDTMRASITFEGHYDVYGRY